MQTAQTGCLPGLAAKAVWPDWVAKVVSQDWAASAQIRLMQHEPCLIPKCRVTCRYSRRSDPIATAPRGEICVCFRSPYSHFSARRNNQLGRNKAAHQVFAIGRNLGGRDIFEGRHQDFDDFVQVCRLL